MRDRGSHKTKRASYIEESWAIVYRNAVIRSCRGSDEVRCRLCYDAHHIWRVPVVGTLPEIRPCVLRGEVGPVGTARASPAW